MAKDYLVEAIHKLRPTAEFVIRDNDYSNIEWHNLDGIEPTQAQIDAAIEEIKAEEAVEANAAAAAKAELLARLGITEAEAKLLLA